MISDPPGAHTSVAPTFDESLDRMLLECPVVTEGIPTTEGCTVGVMVNIELASESDQPVEAVAFTTLAVEGSVESLRNDEMTGAELESAADSVVVANSESLASD